jgi:two-component system, NtrC family, sensor histidine kinase PilS
LRGDYRFSVNGKELRLRFLPVSPDRSRGTVIFIEDWSRVRAHARQLKLASLGRLTANIAHEIRNPLSAISHASQLLQEEENSDPASRRLLQIINDNTLRLDHMVQDILQLSRRDKAHQEIVYLGVFLQEFHDQLCQVEKIDPDQFILELAPDDMPVMFDRRHLHQVLWNLCRNGWRHCRKQSGSLMLRLRAGARISEAEIEISDDGPGVSEEARSHLFEPFFTTDTNGTGLGLYVARELCEANGAGLDYVESRSGARFGIFIKRQYE